MGRKTWACLAWFLLTLSPAFGEDHWCVGCWQTSGWGGVCLRPDGLVTESDPDGNLQDIGRWFVLDDDRIVWVFARVPRYTYSLYRDGTYVVDLGYGYPSAPQQISKSFVPDEYEAIAIEFYEPEPVLDFPEDWK